MKKGQFWYGDFLVAVLILMIIGFLFVASIRDITSRNEVLKDLILDASEISATLMSEGSQDWEEEDWGEEQGQGIGTVTLITNYKFSDNKWSKFLQLDYSHQKSMLGTFNNVWIYLADREGDILDGEYDNSLQILDELGGQRITKVQDINADNLVHIKRFVFYDEDENGEGDIHTLGVVVWQ